MEQPQLKHLVWYLYSYFDRAIQIKAIKKEVKALFLISLELGQFILKGFGSTSPKLVDGRIVYQALLFFKPLHALDISIGRG